MFAAFVLFWGSPFGPGLDGFSGLAGAGEGESQGALGLT